MAKQPALITSYIPGLLTAGALAGIAIGVNRVVPSVGVLMIAVVIGVAASNLGAVPAPARPGLRFAARRMLRVGIVLLGFRLALGDVIELGAVGVMVVVAVVLATLIGMTALGRACRIDRDQTTLLAVGFAICGASAVAAINAVVDGDEDQVTVSIVLVTLCGTVLTFILPAMSHVLAMDDVTAGRWIGAGIHDVGQVVAAAGTVGPAALDAAIVVKLCRVVMLGPLVAVAAVMKRRSATEAGTARPRLVPVFVVGFIAASLVRSLGWLSDGVIDVLRTVETAVLATALAALGTAVDIGALRRIRPRLLVFAGAGVLLVATSAGLGAQL